MAIVDGEVTVTVEGESRKLGAGDVVAISRGREHEVHSETGCTFFEALAPLPLDHVPNFDRDVVLGPDRGIGHVER
jgi:quercetin dioxygenase-like cupin family protein